MYIPRNFDEPRSEVMHALMRARPLATLVTLGSGGLNANHIPLYLSAEDGPYGTLRGHVARANPLWSDFSTAVEALAIFHGPEAYVTPTWYPTKAATGRAVPTWNYAVVHACGTLRAVDDPAWLRAQLAALTDAQETPFPTPWRVADAPGDYIDKLVGAIVGIELPITRLSGKWKVSQNQPPQNQAGVVRGLSERGDPDAQAMAALVEDASHMRQP